MRNGLGLAAGTSTPQPPPLDLHEAVRWYVVRKALENVGGMKALLLDEDTAPSVALVCSQSYALTLQVYLVDKLANRKRKSLGGFRAVCIVRPTAEVVRHLRDELSDPKFDQYHIFFTNTVPEHLIKNLAQYDVQQVVHQVQEIYMDFLPLSHDLFSLDIPSCMALESPSWDQPSFARLTEGLVSVLLALKENPTIAYQKNSGVAQKIAQDMEDRISSGNHTSDHDLFHFGKNTKNSCLLLILDRRDDPVTPLLNQWTYTAMIHEALGIKHNRISLEGAPNSELEEVILSMADDEFYRRARNMEFGELGEALKAEVDDFQKQESASFFAGGGKAKVSSLQDIQRFMDNYPEFKRQQTTVAKHVALTSELSRVVDGNNLWDLSELEQELACTENLTEGFNRVETLIESQSLRMEDKIRLVMLYALRYELEGEREIRFLERSLKDQGINEASLRSISLLKRYAGSAVRGNDIFNKKSVVGAAKTMVKKHFEGIQGVQNVLTRHEPLLMSRLTALKMGGIGALRDSEFKVLGNAASFKPQKVIIFMVGGATYAEARCVDNFNKENAGKGMRVVMGSNTMHNTSSFLEDLLHLDPQS